MPCRLGDALKAMIITTHMSLLIQPSKLENHAGERCGLLPPGFHRPPAPGGPGNHHRPGDHHNRNRPPGDFGDGFDGDSHHHHHQHHRPNHHYPNQNHHHHSHYYPEQAFHSNAGPNGPFGSGGGNDQSPWRKRPFHRPDRGSSSDYMDGGSFAKLYVGFISRTATEQDIRNLFEEYGHIVEIVILKDKITGQQHGSCFVKYPTTEEADRAIKTLNNQYTFPGEGVPLKIRYADGKRERHGTHQQQQQQQTRPYMTEAVGHKLYVNGLNKEASKKEVEEIFSPYGMVEDIYILRDEWKQSRGFGFIEYSHRDMAMAAISALHGTFVMRGCDVPLIVRFAEPKKPKTSETRSTLTSNFGNPLDQHAVHNNSYLRNSCASVQQTSTSLQQEDVSQWKNQPSAAPQIPSQESQVVPDKQAQLQPIHSSTENCEQQQESKINTMQQAAEIVCKAQAVPCPSTLLVADASPTRAVPQVALLDLEDCDWSEHICPDGHRYYYNCTTRESKWEKPEEFRLFEQHFRKWQQSKKASVEQPKSLTKSHSKSSEENPQSLEMPLQSEALHSQSQLQQTFTHTECTQGQAAATAGIGANRV